jgi:hypothetical protein
MTRYLCKYLGYLPIYTYHDVMDWCPNCPLYFKQKCEWEKDMKYCKGKIVDEDKPRNRWIIRCEKCGHIYEGVTSKSLGPICKGERVMNEMIERVYYIRDKRVYRGKKINRPMITVVILHTGDNWARGISICSERDNPRKVRGRGQARKMAREALVFGTDAYPVRRQEAITSIATYWPERLPENSLWCGHVKKSEYMPELTDYEKKLLRIEE